MCWLRGMENVMFDLMDGAEEIYRLRDRLFDFYSKQISLWLEAPVDGIMFSDDWGSQNQLLVSPEVWRSFMKPIYREFISTIKNTGKYVFFHSDGYILDIIEDFIELGVDALNCQVWCMGPEVLGERFAGRIAFWGELDRQREIPWGTPEEIFESARLMKKHLATPRGGLIGQAEVNGMTPLENLEAVLAAWK
jgi:uroporphyrinogen decarboxylase